jgi:hypothetical protein
LPETRYGDSRKDGAGAALLAAAALAALLALVTGCNGPGTGPGQKTPRMVVPPAQSSGADPAAAEAAAASATATTTVPKVPLDSGEKLISVADVNLNLERTDEQILVTKDSGGAADARIRISVVEYDPVLQTYRRSWEDFTSATDERYFTVTTGDVVGDHGVAIICQGATLDNRLTLDIYRRSANAGTKLTYSAIFSAVAAGDIAIQQEARSQAYLSGTTEGKPFPIVVTERDPESPDAVDIVKTTYQWSTLDRRYLATGKTRVRGEAVEREQLQALFSSNSPDQYLQFLAGSWLRSDQESPSPSSSMGELLRFSPQDHTLQIFSARNRVQEDYIWDKADCYYGNVTIRAARNSILPDITKDVRVSVQTRQEVLVSVESTIDRTDAWKGVYRRVSEQALTQQLADPRRGEAVLQPSGLYDGTDGSQLVFEAPHVSWIDKSGTLSGGFYLYRLDRLVLGITIQKGYGERSEERAYIVEQSTRTDSKRTTITLALRPAELTVYGARPLSEEVITFTQVQQATSAGTSSTGATSSAP